jgi:beta-mannosidase
VPATFPRVLLAVIIACAAAPAQGRTTVALDRGWKFRQAGEDAWRPARVPGSAHTDLVAAGVAPDPFYRDNEQRLQWVGRAGSEYRTTFEADAALLARERVELVFDGIDTYATVLVNGRPLLEADNMFRRWRVDCKAALRPGANALEVRFRSPIAEALPKLAERDYRLPADNDQGEKTAPYTRKAPYQFGWDWGPRFVTCGLWRPVRLEAWDTARVADVHVVQNALSPEAADLTARVTVVATRALDATVTVDGPKSGVGPVARRVALSAGENVVEVPVRIRRPRLWWPNGLGEHPLYELRARLDAAGATDAAATRIGLRTLEVRRVDDRWGKSFAFVVNGVPVFAKGANWIPADSFPERVTAERYRALLTSAARANMNMLRVWGGGYYEDDRFYDLCDELGLLVWQDFMFACSMYPGDDAFLESVRREAVDNVVRLRNHPSVALWCGNNEIEEAWEHWGWKKQLPASVWADYEKLFEGVLPAVCAEYDPSRVYWPSSPSSNGEDDPDSQRTGDAHYWGVWHAAEPFEAYRKQFPRFLSEYGFQSFPLAPTVASYTAPEDRDVESTVMRAHQRHPRGNQLIREYMLREYPAPKDFDAFLYTSQVLQAEGIKLGAEHFRRSRPRTMGSLFWQLDDCWPVASWSSVDYFGRWKALQFYARRFYADVLLSAVEDNGAVAFYVVSDRTAPVRARLNVRLLDFGGRVVSQRSAAVEVAPLASRPYLTVPAGQLLGSEDSRAVYVSAELVAGGRTLSASRLFFRPYKELAAPRPSVRAEVRGREGALRVAVSTDALARDVYVSFDGVDAELDDNFFDLDPGGRVEVAVRAPGLTPAEARRRLRVATLADAFQTGQATEARP